MSLVVLARPDWRPADRAWLVSLRDRHGGAYFDPGLGPHITLVFPVEEPEKGHGGIVSHVRTVAAETAAFDTAWRVVMPVRDSFSGDTFLYLCPDEGSSTLIRLHDRLYTGPLADELRLDLPYIPHVTLGRFSSARIAKALADDLNAGEPELRVRVETVELLRLPDGKPAEPVGEFVLSG